MAARKSPGGGKGQDKVWSDAIRIAAFRKAEQGDQKKIQQAADKLVEKAIAGDIAAMKEIGDRLDGKAIQPTEVSGSLDGSFTIVTGVPNGNGD